MLLVDLCDKIVLQEMYLNCCNSLACLTGNWKESHPAPVHFYSAYYYKIISNSLLEIYIV